MQSLARYGLRIDLESHLVVSDTYLGHAVRKQLSRISGTLEEST